MGNRCWVRSSVLLGSSEDPKLCCEPEARHPEGRCRTESPKPRGMAGKDEVGGRPLPDGLSLEMAAPLPWDRAGLHSPGGAERAKPAGCCLACAWCCGAEDAATAGCGSPSLRPAHQERTRNRRGLQAENGQRGPEGAPAPGSTQPPRGSAPGERSQPVA